MPADASSAALRFWQESTFGEYAAATPTFTDLRLTGETLRQDTNSTSSQEIRSDRQVPDIIRTGISAAGEINFELSQDSYDEFLEAALLSAAWTAPATVISASTSVGFTAGTNVIDLAVGSWTLTPTVGDWIFVSGSTSNDGVYKVTAAGASTITVNHGTLITEGATASVTITVASYIKNGTTFRSFNIEREYTDLSNEFAQFAGMTIESMSLNTSADAIVTGSFGFLGKKEQSATATLGDGSPTAVPTTQVMNAIDHVIGVFENGTAFDLASFGMTLNNNLRARLKIGTLGAYSIGKGTVDVGGSFQVPYESKTLFDKYLNWTASSIAFIYNVGAEYYVFDFPQVRLTTGQRPAQGINSDVVADIGFSAYLDPTEALTVKIVRVT